jgi:ABC-type branched-subunit amino acid transport system substrate-binding protein
MSAAVLLAVIALAGCGPKKQASIKVGIYGSMTGTTATFGKSTLNGAQLAFDELNAAGGIGVKKIEYVSEDDQSKAQSGGGERSTGPRDRAHRRGRVVALARGRADRAE